jgi:predicted DNA-binding transcriptional regulator AlpA
VTPDELVGFTEVAQLLTVAESTAARYIKRPDFPEPVGRLARGHVWRRRDVDSWAKRTLPLPTGRPRKRS